MRIVTLLPSATEIVCALGLEDRLVGVSHSCDYPPKVRDLPAMTSTSVPYTESSDVIDTFVRGHLSSSAALYDLDMPALVAAAPDFIISQALCDVCAVSTGDVVAALGSLPTRPQLVDLEPNTLDEVLDDCARVGASLHAGVQSRELVNQLRSRRAEVAERTARITMGDRPGVAFLEWLMPPFNGGHWNPELVELAGGIDLLGAPGEPSHSLNWERVAAAEPDILFVACCGFEKERAIEDLQQVLTQNICQAIPAVQSGNVYVADGNAYFSRPGPRLIDGLEMMAHAFHPTIHPPSEQGACDLVRV